MYSEVGDRFYRPTSEIDFNNLLVSGYYIGKLSKNTPDGTTSANWIIEVQAFDNNPNYVYQRATRASDKRTFTRYREGYNDIGWKDWEISATKSDLASTDITPTPISGLVFSPATMFKKAGVAYLNLQISNTTSSAISMENGKVIATGLPIPYKKQQVYVEAIPWNNGAIGSNASTTPLRLCIDNTGRLCSYYPSANEKITPGMPICINMAYPIAE